MDTINDPAWFYSSLAQTAAAIVGLIGAVLGSRIIEHIGLLRGERKLIDEQIASVGQSIRQNTEQINDLCEWLETEIATDEKELAAGRTTRIIRTTRTFGRSSHSTPGTEEDLAKHKAALEVELPLARRTREVYEPLTGQVNPQDSLAYAGRLEAFADDLTRTMPERESYANMTRSGAQQLRQVVKQVSDAQAKLLPASFKFVFVLLIWLSLTGVIWPLLALPGSTSTHPKVLMLGALVIGMLGLIGFFAYQFVELWRLGRFTWRT